LLPGWLIARARFRSSFLVILGCIQIPYGIALLLSQRSDVPVLWWPGALRTVDGVSVTAWGWVWIACGVFVLATCWRIDDRVPFAVCVMLNFVWAALAIQRGLTSPRDTASWGPGVIYLGISVGVLMISAWPDPVTLADVKAPDDERAG
jgi:hypothetical protein